MDRGEKKAIYSSRVDATRFLAQTITSLSPRPRAFLSASAIGYYGDRNDQEVNEDSAAGSNFLAEVCQNWEQACRPIAEAGIRVVNMRLGIVLGKNGGALAQMLPLFKKGMGGHLGSGKQWMSWISLEDTIRAIVFLLENTNFHGPVNISVPNPVRNQEFCKVLASVLHKPAIMSVPAFALKMKYGQMADEVLLASTKAIPLKIREAGFKFELPNLHYALTQIMKEEDS